MAKTNLKKLWFGQKFDGVIEAVHYVNDNGKIDWVRAYVRRGPTWSDHLILDRKSLLKALEDGKRFYTGERVSLQGSEFKLGHRVLVKENGKGKIIVTEKTIQETIDHLNGVPIL